MSCKNKNEPWKDREWLVEKYHEEDLSHAEIAEICDAARTTISYWINKYNIRSKKSIVEGTHRDEELLRRLYCDEGLSAKQIATRLDCGERTVYDWLQKFDIETRRSTDNYWKEGAPWKNKETLEHLYHEKSLSLREIAHRLGCSEDAVLYWMKSYDIQRRDRVEGFTRAIRKHPTNFTTTRDGYETWRCEVDGVKHPVRVHRLVAVAEYGLEAVVGKHVHHKNGIPWDNRPENLKCLSPSEHSKLHAQARGSQGDLQ
jgi:transposase